MKKVERVDRKISFMKFSALIVVLLALFSYSGYLKANDEESGYQFHIIKCEDGTAADIVGDDTKLKDGVTIKQVVDPYGQTMDLQQASFHVTKNADYSFQIDFSSETGNHTEIVQITVSDIISTDKVTDQKPDNMQKGSEQEGVIPENDTDVPALPVDEGSTLTFTQEKTIGELKAEKRQTMSATTSFDIPMYIEGETKPQSISYPFGGGDIINIKDQNFNNLPYKFLRAEITLKEDGMNKTYPIDYYDEINGQIYYSLVDEGGTAQDFEVAYVAPADSSVSFIFTLNTQRYSVILNNTLADQKFSVEYITGITKDESTNTFHAKEGDLVKVVLHYPLGYYVENAPLGEENVGIKFDDPNLPVTKEEDKKNRTIAYIFRFPDKSIRMDVVGTQQTTALVYGVYDRTGNFENHKEQGITWWKATDANGVYTEGKPYYGYGDGDATNKGTLMVRGGTSKPVKIEGKSDLVNIATDTYAYNPDSSDNVLYFDYAINRWNTGNVLPFYYLPPSVLSITYFPNGSDMTGDDMITELVPLWSSDWSYDPNDLNASIIENKYTIANDVTVTVTVKKAVVDQKASLKVPDYHAHVK